MKKTLLMMLWIVLTSRSMLAIALEPVKVLYVTSVGWFHDYESQTRLMANAVGAHMDARLDVIVGDVERLKQADFARGYDVVVYNFCHAARRDGQLLDNLLRPAMAKGTPVLVVHCAMHSFQHMAAWPAFLGLHTLRHEKQRGLTVTRVAQHPVTAGLPERFELASDELYLNISVAGDSRPLLTAYGVESKQDQVLAWIRPVGSTELIGITLGHDETTLQDANFQRFIANAVLYLSGREAAGDGCDPGCKLELNMLSQPVRYPTPGERRCVINKMFAIGGEKVAQCTDQCKRDGVTPAEQCEPQCQIDHPWPNPESLWPSCQV